MGILKILAVSGTLAIATTGLAAAADMPEVPVIDNAVEPELGTNWYLRGDIGVAWTSLDLDVTMGSTDSVSNDGWTWSGGGGVGYDFGWFRSDITLDYIAQRSTGVSTQNTLCSDGSLAAITCTNNHDTGVNAVPLMWNAYFDLGTWDALTPYVGAGAGAALVAFDPVRITSTGITGVATADGTEDWRFAWSVMAGFSYNINQNLALDVGYRFLAITDGSVAPDIRSSAATGIGSIDFSNFYTHTVRAGFRYTID